MSGGWAAKELCERGLKVLVLERGRHIEHRGPEYSDMLQPWERKNYDLIPEDFLERPEMATVAYALTPDNLKWFTKREDVPYTTAEGKPFTWVRAHNLGGRSLLWSRQTYRMGDHDFRANAEDGHGVPWPIGYDDLKPWYDHVDRFAGIAGSQEGLPQVPDGQFQKPFGFTAVEKHLKTEIEKAFPNRNVIHGRCAHLTEPTEEQEALGRVVCQQRKLCSRGCSFGGYFSSLSATLPAAEKTGNLTIVTDAIVSSLEYDDKAEKVTGVRVIDANTKAGSTYRAKAVFLCASTFGSLQVLFNSTSEAMPEGLGNTHDVLGRYITDHIVGGGASGNFTQFDDRYYEGRRPTGFYIPRFRNVTEPGDGYVRGGGFQSGSQRQGIEVYENQPGFGAANKHAGRTPGKWVANLGGFGEMLPRWENRMSLNAKEKDKWGIPLVHFDVGISDNERAMSKQLGDDAVAMLEAAGAVNIKRKEFVHIPGERIHEMGGAPMGDDPTKSVTNKYNQLHVAKNVFVTDGSCFPSGGCQNPSISYMAMTARAANNAAEMLKEGLFSA